MECEHVSLGRYFCHRCADRIGNESVPGTERYSMQIYAGTYCDTCWGQDGRNHDRQFDPMDAGGHYSEEDY